jgi:hypothetical protein
MKKKLLAIPVLILVLTLVLAVSAGACPPPPDEEGCTPGYWKNHLDQWPDYLGSGDYYIVKVTTDYYIVKSGEDDYYIIKLANDYYIVKLEGDAAIDRLAGDYYIVKLGNDYYIVKLDPPDIENLGGDYYIVKLGTDYYIVKGAMAYPGGTSLLDALKARGPGSELYRHGAAAFLNATSPDVDYGLTLAEVFGYLEAGNAAPLVEANEQYCPLN